jgi:glycosyltransferase involved in cell wall biosynthesis
MKVLQVNTSYKYGGSTGRIVYDLKQTMNEQGIKNYVAFGYEYSQTNDLDTLKMQSIPYLKYSILKTRLLGRHGFYNIRSTKRLLEYIEKINPDVIHLHNLHNHYINVEILFNYIKSKNIPILWTLHDCWAFTGWCAYFDYIGCRKWQSSCHHCPSLRDYPYTWFFDRSQSNFKRKKQAFCGVDNLTIVTPSLWLSNLVTKSFLKNYPIKVINNGVDLNIFRPLASRSEVKERLGLKGKKMILAIAMHFAKRKGVEFLLQLPEILKEDEYLVLVGLDEHERKLFSRRNCVCILRTSNVEELVELYSAADVFVNPTLEDNFPTTNIEALACGTPVVTFNTGGSIESIDRNTGFITKYNCVEDLYKCIQDIFSNKKMYQTTCRNRSVNLYDKKSLYNQYIELYKKLSSNHD